MCVYLHIYVHVVYATSTMEFIHGSGVEPSCRSYRHLGRLLCKPLKCLWRYCTEEFERMEGGTFNCTVIMTRGGASFSIKFREKKCYRLDRGDFSGWETSLKCHRHYSTEVFERRGGGTFNCTIIIVPFLWEAPASRKDFK